MSNYSQYEEFQPRITLPSITWAVRVLILINIAVFIIQLLIHIPFGYYPPDLIASNNVAWWFAFQPELWWLPWKVITYQFLHANLLHLFFNMLWLFFFGGEVERMLGSRGLLRFYLICGAVGVLFNMPAYLIGTNPGDIPIVGASGSVMALLIAFAMINPDRQFFLFPLPFPITARGLVVIVIVMNIIQSMGNNGISVATHFGGMAAGYVYIKFLPKAMQYYRDNFIHKKKESVNKDKVGEAVDNIFEMKDWKK